MKRKRLFGFGILFCLLTMICFSIPVFADDWDTSYVDSDDLGRDMPDDLGFADSEDVEVTDISPWDYYYDIDTITSVSTYVTGYTNAPAGTSIEVKIGNFYYYGQVKKSGNFKIKIRKSSIRKKVKVTFRFANEKKRVFTKIVRSESKIRFKKNVIYNQRNVILKITNLAYHDVVKVKIGSKLYKQTINSRKKYASCNHTDWNLNCRD